MVERDLHNSRSEIKPILRADIFKRNIGTKEQRSNLVTQVRLRMKTMQSFPNSNDGCWRAEIRYNNADWLYAELHDMLEEAIQFYLKEDPAYKHVFTDKIPTIDTWTNVNKPGSMNRIHSHKECAFVGLYYLQCEGTGDLTFVNPANYLSDCSLNSPSTSRMSHIPKDGDLILWPAWVPHEVEINNSNLYRINIAFNILI